MAIWVVVVTLYWVGFMSLQLRCLTCGEAFTLTGPALGGGGEAAIYPVPALRAFPYPLVAKVYHAPSQERYRKLEAMLANPPDDPMRARGHVAIAWPVDLVGDAEGFFVGYLMPLIRDARPIIDLYHPATRRQRCPLFDYYYLHVTARNLAAAVSALHARGYVIGDVNESNVMVTQQALATLVDTDSFQVPDPATGACHRCPVGKPEYTPPELQDVRFGEVDRAPDHDRFGLGVLLFQLLYEGTLPFDGQYTGGGEPLEYPTRVKAGYFPSDPGARGPFRPKPLAPPFEVPAPALQALFRRCFVGGHQEPSQRPTARDWLDALDRAAAELITCARNPHHRYGGHLTACPWCARAAQLHGRDPFPISSTATIPPLPRSPAPPPPGSRSRLRLAPVAPPPPPSRPAATPWKTRVAAGAAAVAALAAAAAVLVLAAPVVIGWGRPLLKHGPAPQPPANVSAARPPWFVHAPGPPGTAPAPRPPAPASAGPVGPVAASRDQRFRQAMDLLQGKQNFAAALPLLEQNIAEVPNGLTSDYDYGWACFCAANLGQWDTAARYFAVMRSRYPGTISNSSMTRNFDSRMSEVLALARASTAPAAKAVLPEMERRWQHPGSPAAAPPRVWPAPVAPAAVGQEAGVPVVGQPWTVPGLGLEMVWVAPGTFQMGSSAVQLGGKPIHAVRLTKGYWLGKYEVTQGEWEAIMGANPSYFTGARNPVENVSWEDAAPFCKKLAERATGRLPAGYEYRLPTEAEWEYAARGGARGRGTTYSGSNNVDEVAWHRQNSGKTTHAVGGKRANELGLYDMSGNVSEWCQDWCGTCPAGAAVDPAGATTGWIRVFRGGNWDAAASSCRVASGGGEKPDRRARYLGCRLALAVRQ